MLTTPIIKKFFITIDYSCTEGGEEAINTITVRKRIKNKIHKKADKAFKYRVITRDNRIKQQLRILYQGKEELDIVKRAATTKIKEGARVLQNQLYPIKINNVRTDTIL